VTEKTGAPRARLAQLAALVAVAVVLVVVAIVLSSGGGSSKKATPSSGTGGLQDTAQVATLLKGIPQSGLTLGDPKAPVTIAEFVDPQCPFCRDFALGELPAIVQRDVRSGKAKIELRLLTFIGPDSLTAARVLLAAGAQGKLFNALDVLYHNQGKENSGYLTDAYLRKVLGAVPGLNAGKAIAAAAATSVSQDLGAAKTLASRYAVDATPTLLVGPTGGALKKTEATSAAVGTAVAAAAGSAP
jgi:protein-disulfide isomerase